MPRPVFALLVAAVALAGCSAGALPQRASSAISSPPSSSATTSVAATRSSSPSVRRTPTPARPTQASAPSPTPALPTVVFPPGTGPLVALDPGHDGGSEADLAAINQPVPSGFGQTKACNTTGTNTDAGYPEHAFNFDVALRVRAILQAHGVRVIMTRQDDTSVGPCVNQRAAILSTRGVVAAVAIHADGAPADGHGFHVNECSQVPQGATAATWALAKALGVAEHDALAAGSGLVPSTYIGTDGYVYRSDLADLNLSTVPTSFLELGNMRNAGDAALESSAAGRQRIAAAVAAGILDYLAAHH